MMEIMPMKRLLSSKRGSSLVIASALMIIVTLIGGIFFYNYIMGSVNSMTDNLNKQMSILLLDSVKVNGTCIVAWIRNTGSSAVSVVNAYVNEQIALLSNEVKIAATSAATAYIRGTYMQGGTYSVKLSGMIGTLLTFSVKY